MTETDMDILAKIVLKQGETIKHLVSTTLSMAVRIMDLENAINGNRGN